MRQLDDDRWYVDDGLHELAHFLYLVDALKYCVNYGEKLYIRHRQTRHEWGEWAK